MAYYLIYISFRIKDYFIHNESTVDIQLDEPFGCIFSFHFMHYTPKIIFIIRILRQGHRESYLAHTPLWYTESI